MSEKLSERIHKLVGNSWPDEVEALEAELEAMERRALDMEYAADNNNEACKLLEAKLETMERLKTYAMLLESHVGYGYVNEIRHQLGVTDEMIYWSIPADHRKLLDAAQEEKE